MRFATLNDMGKRKPILPALLGLCLPACTMVPPQGAAGLTQTSGLSPQTSPFASSPFAAAPQPSSQPKPVVRQPDPVVTQAEPAAPAPIPRVRPVARPDNLVPNGDDALAPAPANDAARLASQARVDAAFAHYQTMGSDLRLFEQAGAGAGDYLVQRQKYLEAESAWQAEQARHASEFPNS